MKIDHIIDQYDTHDEQSYEQDIPLNFSETSNENAIDSFNIDNKYKFRGFIDVGDGSAAMLMEDQYDYNLSFIRITSISAEDGFNMTTCGIHDSTRN